MSSKRHIVVFSGGSAANNLIDVFNSLCKDRRSLDYVLPISDNGGSSSELIRVFGGPGIGDVRSRLIRLVPEDTEDEELAAIKAILNHRLPASNEAARTEWLSIVDGTHALWEGISSEKRELLRSFFVLVNSELIKRQRPKSSFNFHSAACGNLFLTGARIFFNSFESAIYLFRSIAGVPGSVSVIPAINSNFTHHIAAVLEDGSVISGQNQISHPSAEIAAEYAEDDEDDLYAVGEHAEDANYPGTLRELRSQNIVFDKKEEKQLPSRIDRIVYINAFGQEIRPPANPKVVAGLREADAVVYSIGSLYTSLVPCLILRNVGPTILSCASARKIFLLNGTHDRETAGLAATDFVRAAVKACGGDPADANTWWNYVTHLIYIEGCPIGVDVLELEKANVCCVNVGGRRNEDGGLRYDPKSLLQALEMVLGTKTPRRRMTMG